MENVNCEVAKALLEASPEYIPYFEILVRAAHVEGEFVEGYCSEISDEEGQVLKEREYWLLNSQATRCYEWNRGGESIISNVGPGWFTFSVSCTMASGIEEMWVDGSITRIFKDYCL